MDAYLEMDWSFGEYAALAAKAFRGAGYSWGLAEDAAFAAKRLAEFDLASGEIIASLLATLDGSAVADAMPDSNWQSGAGSALCPICVGAAIVDRGGWERTDLGPVYAPLLLAPFLQQVAEDLSYLIEWSGGRCEVTNSSIAASTATSDAHDSGKSEPAMVTIVRAPRGHDLAPTKVQRVSLQPSTRATLEEFAHRIYAPATEQSRQGAGE